MMSFEYVRYEKSAISCIFIDNPCILMYIICKISNMLQFTMKNIARQILERRKKLGLSQQDLSEISGVSIRTIISVESGNSNPSVNVLSKMIKPLGFIVSLRERVKND